MIHQHVHGMHERRGRAVQLECKTVLGAFMLSLNVPYLSLSIGLVDSRTGEVLLFAKPVALTDVVDQGDKRLYKPLANSVKKLPSAP